MVTTLWMVYSPPNCALQQGASNDVRIRSQLKKKKKELRQLRRLMVCPGVPRGLQGRLGGSGRLLRRGTGRGAPLCDGHTEVSAAVQPAAQRGKVTSWLR